MSNPLATSDLTTSFISMLSIATSRSVGDGEGPIGANINQGYYVVYGIPISGDWETLSAPLLDADLVYQVTSVGKTREHCEWLADRARLTVIGRSGVGFQVPLNPPAGVSVINRRPESGLPGTPVPEGTPPNQRWSVAERFLLSITSDV